MNHAPRAAGQQHFLRQCGGFKLARMLLQAFQQRHLRTDSVELHLTVAPTGDGGQHAIRDQQRQCEHENAAYHNPTFPRMYSDGSQGAPRAAAGSPAV